MERQDLQNLVLKAITEELSEEERNLLEEKAIPGYRFSGGFRERVMERIAGTGAKVISVDFRRSLDRVFLRTALTGAAAIALLVITMLLTQGSLSYDTLLGFDNSVDEGLISLLIE